MSDAASRFPDLPAEMVSAILGFARERQIRTAHYVGNADRGLIEGFTVLLGRDGISVTDIPDRWRTGFAFWWDEREFPGTPCPERPAWLEDISCYQEGMPDESDLIVWETPWDRASQFLRILAFRRKAGWQPSPNVALLGEARKIRLPEVYEWTVTDDLALGILRDSVKPPRRRRGIARAIVPPR